MIAATEGCLEICKLLVSKGADVNISTKDLYRTLPEFNVDWYVAESDSDASDYEDNYSNHYSSKKNFKPEDRLSLCNEEFNKTVESYRRIREDVSCFYIYCVL